MGLKPTEPLLPGYCGVSNLEDIEMSEIEGEGEPDNTLAAETEQKLRARMEEVPEADALTEAGYNSIGLNRRT